MTQTRGKIAVITGGTAGVGRATVREFARRGYDVAILARGAAGLKGAAEDVKETGHQALALPVDVADAEAVRQAAENIEAELGEISVWVNVAFTGSLAYFWDTSTEEFHRMTEVTYYGQVHGTLTALERMRPRDRGVIINVGSALAYRGIPLQSAYCGAKHAVVGFTESVRCELSHEKSKVRLCTVQLPAMDTPQFNWNLSRMRQHPCRSRRSSSPRWRPAASRSSPSIRGGTCGSASPPPILFSPSEWLHCCSTSTWAETASSPSCRTRPRPA
jgi:NAD(P)-dependent dehydrogenase (short-subunit alcohol dehydrogenase family)